jgi:hypothetical protein
MRAVINLLAMLTALGFYNAREISLARKGSCEEAKTAIADGPKPRIGRGMDAGHIVVEAQNGRVEVALLTPWGRGWCGPLFEGRIAERTSDSTVLRGRFRLTYGEMITAILCEFGVLGQLVWSLGTAAQQGGVAFATFVWAASAVGIMVLPRVSWHVREWKMGAVLQYLESCGFHDPCRSSQNQ